MKTPYRILKLRSGEEIIAKLMGEQKGKIIVERPMIFMTKLVMDPYSGRQRELTILRNWLSHTAEIQTKIPKDYIATYLIPDNTVMELYALEKEKEDVDPIDPSITNLTETMKKDLNSEMKSINDMLPDDFQNLMDMVRDAVEKNPELWPEFLENPEPEQDTINPHQPKNYISMSMFLPPEALISLVDSGIIDEEDLVSLIENINGSKKEYKGDDKNRQADEDFGNDWQDWSPDLKDYFK